MCETITVSHGKDVCRFMVVDVQHEYGEFKDMHITLEATGGFAPRDSKTLCRDYLAKKNRPEIYRLRLQQLCDDSRSRPNGLD